MKLRTKIPLVVAGAVICACSAGLLGLWQMKQAAVVYQQVLAVDVEQERNGAAMLLDFKTQVQEWKNTLLRGRDSEQRGKYWASFEAHETKVAEAARRLERTVAPGPARDLLGRFVQAHAAMGADYRRGFEAFSVAGFDAAAGDGAVKGMDRAPSKLVVDATEAIAQATQVAVAKAEQRMQFAERISVGIMLVVGVGALLGAGLVARGVVRAVERARRVAETVADGDLSSEIEVSGRDEVADLLASLKRMNDALADVVGTVRSCADSVATGTGQISHGNVDLSQRTEEQAANLQQTAASMEQVSAAAKQSRAAAQGAAGVAADASQVAARGGSAMAQVVQTMSSITASSSRIADITGVIDGIAFQTNILALNAAVEAARAGDHGKGFAVVASEVRSLAQRSAEAAKQIRQLIAESSSTIEAGSHLVQQAGATIEGIARRVGEVDRLIGDIAASSGEQTAGIEQIELSLHQLDQVTQQNAALVEESAAASQNLQQQATRLVAAVSRFRVDSR